MKFKLDTILTITTGKIVTDNYSELQKILCYMTGDVIFHHQFGRASKVCKLAILEKYPALKNVQFPNLKDEKEIREWVAKQAKIYGTELDVPTLKTWEHEDPIQELLDDHKSRLKG